MRKLILTLTVLIISALIYFAIYGSGKRNKSVLSGRNSSPRELLMHDLFTHGGILIYPASDPVYSKEFKSHAGDFTIFFRRAKLKIIPDTSVTEKELKNYTVFIIGTIRSNIILKKISGRLPVKFSYSGFTFNNNT